MNALSVVEPHPSIGPAVEAIAIRMADEGIPVRAIARATRLPSPKVYDIIRDAIQRGAVVELPRDDWPTDTNRTTRNAFIGTPLETEDELKFACSRCFKATPLESAVLAVMLRRSEITKNQIHAVIEQCRPGDNRPQTDPKMVDVVICHLRKKLKTFDLFIETVWGTGYLIPNDSRERAYQMLTAHLFKPIVVQNTPSAPETEVA